jgi:predicted TIM-barrel fold metal-dependent hydrolase
MSNIFRIKYPKVISSDKIIDVHVHICPSEIRDNREKFFDREPEFSSIYKDPRARLVGCKDLIKTMDDEGVAVAVVFGLPWRKKEHCRLNNNYVIDAAIRFPDRLIAFATFDALNSNAQKEADRCFSKGAKGLGELAFYTDGLNKNAVKALSVLADLCKEVNNAPILLHTNESVGHIYPGKSPMTLIQLYNLIKKHKDNKWILAHLGGGLPFYGFMKKEVKEVLSNCWFDTAAMPFLYKPDAIKAMADAVGIEKFMLGTDYPLLAPSKYKKEFEKSGLNKDEIDMLLFKNAESFINNLIC